MSSQLLIESGLHETRAALLEEGRLVEVHIERGPDAGVVGSIYRGRVSRVLPGIQAAFVDIGLDRDAFLYVGDLQPTAAGSPSIESVVKSGQELIVQVIKEPLPGKGARITSQITLPGLFLVLLPGVDSVSIARRITAPEERRRLESLLREIRPEAAGLIARTAGAGRTDDELLQDLRRQEQRWDDIQSRATTAKAPALLYQELGLPERAVRDLLDESVGEVWVEGDAAHARITEFLQAMDTPMAEKVRCYREAESLFDRFDVEVAIDKALQSRVWLRSGGFLVINSTEALVAIDVNTGRYTGASDLEATALETNLEAAVEVARQIRLRDLSGIIVVDFIDMADSEHQARVLTHLESVLENDRARTQVAGVSEFGLVEITRKRIRGGLQQRLAQPCPCCAGKGWTKGPASVALELGRALRRRPRGSGQSLRLRAHPHLVKAWQEEQGELLAELEAERDQRIELEEDHRLRPDEYEIVTS